MKNLISKAGRAIALQAVALASCFAMFSAISIAHAEMPPLPQQMWQGKSDVQVADEARRDPNKYCTQCHETANATGKPFSHAGKHFQHGTKSPNSGEQVTCVSCHGNMSENHRKGVRDVMRFSKMDVRFTSKIKCVWRAIQRINCVKNSGLTILMQTKLRVQTATNFTQKKIR